MATIAENILALAAEKTALADNLSTKGVSAVDTESLTSLVDKVLDIVTEIPNFIFSSNIIVNSDFKNTIVGIGGWSNNVVNSAIVDGALRVLASAQWASIRQQVPFIDGHIYYLGGYCKGHGWVGLEVSGTASVAGVLSESSFVMTSVLYTATATETRYINLLDNRPSGWDYYYAKKIFLYDLTAAYGAGNEPEKSIVDSYITTLYE